jgi:transcriptional/translational regulatory protein YebC/TACO1
LKYALTAVSFNAEAAEIAIILSNKADMNAETAPKLLRLIDMLEDYDDVQEVATTDKIFDEIAARL